MKKIIGNKYQISILFFIILSIILFGSIDYLIQLNLDNFDIIVLKNSSNNDLVNLDTKINQLSEQLRQLQLETTTAKSFSYPTLSNIKKLSKKYILSIVVINKIEDVDQNRTKYNISLKGSVYNIIKFLKSFESTYISDIKFLTLQPNDLSGEKLTLQLSILLKK